MNHEREELRVTSDARNKLTRDYKSILEYIGSWLDRETYAVLSARETSREQEAVNLITVCCELRKNIFEVCASADMTIQVKMSGGSTRFYGFLNGRLMPERFRTLVTSATKPVRLPHIHVSRSSAMDNAIIPILTTDRFGIAILILDYAALAEAASLKTINNDAEKILERSALKIYYKSKEGRFVRELESDLLDRTALLWSQNLLHVKNGDIRELLLRAAVENCWRSHKSASLLISALS